MAICVPALWWDQLRVHPLLHWFLKHWAVFNSFPLSLRSDIVLGRDLFVEAELFPAVHVPLLGILEVLFDLLWRCFGSIVLSTIILIALDVMVVIQNIFCSLRAQLRFFNVMRGSRLRSFPWMWCRQIIGSDQFAICIIKLQRLRDVCSPWLVTRYYHLLIIILVAGALMHRLQFTA